MSILTNSDLKGCLLKFQQIFNDHSRVKKLIKNWNRAICVESTDTGEQYSMLVADLAMHSVVDGIVEDEDQLDNRILLQAEAEVLEQIFSGDYNPATAHIDGALAVFSPDKDKVKLEAIAMVIWGLS